MFCILALNTFVLLRVPYTIRFLINGSLMVIGKSIVDIVILKTAQITSFIAVHVVTKPLLLVILKINKSWTYYWNYLSETCINISNSWAIQIFVQSVSDKGKLCFKDNKESVECMHNLRNLVYLIYDCSTCVPWLSWYDICSFMSMNKYYWSHILIFLFHYRSFWSSIFLQFWVCLSMYCKYVPVGINICLFILYIIWIWHRCMFI